MGTTKKNASENEILPDVRLARLFDFTAADLAANRSGFLSWGQRWQLGCNGQRYWGWLIPYIQGRRVGITERVATVCGRIRLVYQVREVFMVRQARMVETFTLTFVHHGHSFPLSRAQYSALHDGTVYRVYHHGQTLLTLERAPDGCGA
jgi:hypothetical protein